MPALSGVAGAAAGRLLLDAPQAALLSAGELVCGAARPQPRLRSLQRKPAGLHLVKVLLAGRHVARAPGHAVSKGLGLVGAWLLLPHNLLRRGGIARARGRSSRFGAAKLVGGGREAARGWRQGEEPKRGEQAAERYARHACTHLRRLGGCLRLRVPAAQHRVHSAVRQRAACAQRHALRHHAAQAGQHAAALLRHRRRRRRCAREEAGGRGGGDEHEHGVDSMPAGAAAKPSARQCSDSARSAGCPCGAQPGLACWQPGRSAVLCWSFSQKSQSLLSRWRGPQRGHPSNCLTRVVHRRRRGGGRRGVRLRVRAAGLAVGRRRRRGARRGARGCRRGEARAGCSEEHQEQGRQGPRRLASGSSDSEAQWWRSLAAAPSSKFLRWRGPHCAVHASVGLAFSLPLPARGPNSPEGRETPPRAPDSPLRDLERGMVGVTRIYERRASGRMANRSSGAFRWSANVCLAGRAKVAKPWLWRPSVTRSVEEKACLVRQSRQEAPAGRTTSPSSPRCAVGA